MAESSLICTETENECFDDLDGVVDEKSHQNNGKDLGLGHCRSEPLVGLPCLSEEDFSVMVERESGHLPKDDYLKRLRSGDLHLSVRKQALDWIYKAHAHYGFREQCFVLALNYLDRFLSVYELPRDKTWTVQLLAVACLSLAAKMEEIEVPLTVDLQVGDPKFVFEGKTIQRMELLVLTTLKWKMQSYTPCTFIDYFLKKITKDRFPLRPLICKSHQLIMCTIKGIDFLELRPSEIAAAVAMSVSGEIESSIDIYEALSRFKQVDKGRVLKCLEMIHGLTLSNYSTLTNVARASISSVVPQSPNGVLEASCLSYKSDERTVGSRPNSSQTSPDTKRRKLDTPASLEGDLNKS